MSYKSIDDISQRQRRIRYNCVLQRQRQQQSVEEPVANEGNMGIVNHEEQSPPAIIPFLVRRRDPTTDFFTAPDFGDPIGENLAESDESSAVPTWRQSRPTRRDDARREYRWRPC